MWLIISGLCEVFFRIEGPEMGPAKRDRACRLARTSFKSPIYVLVGLQRLCGSWALG